MAKLVDSWSKDLAACPKLLSEMSSWNAPVRGLGRPKKDILFGFDVKWLDERPANFLPDCWSGLQDLLSHSNAKKDKYKIMMLLCGMAYSSFAKQDLVRALLAFATVPEVRAIQPPSFLSFNLNDGFVPVRHEVIQIVQSHVKQLVLCPENDLPPLPGGEDTEHRLIRLLALHKEAYEKEVTAFVDDIMRQPINQIRTPTGSSLYKTYISVDDAINEISPLFGSWYRNSLYQNFTQKVQVCDSHAPCSTNWIYMVLL
jgi:hypothetical protein